MPLLWKWAIHGLSCHWRWGHRHWHVSVTSCAGYLPQLRYYRVLSHHAGLCCTDGKWPDHITVVQWKSRKLLVRGATCPNAFAPSYSSSATREDGAVADLAVERNINKHAHLSLTHAFTSVAIEMAWVFGQQTIRFLKDLGCCLAQVTDERSTPYPL